MYEHYNQMVSQKTGELRQISASTSVYHTLTPAGHTCVICQSTAPNGKKTSHRARQWLRNDPRLPQSGPDWYLKRYRGCGRPLGRPRK